MVDEADVAPAGVGGTGRDPARSARPGLARRPRRDAERNRRLLVQAAVETFRVDGLDVALDAIARRAGVGNATLYRHFPTREDLYEAVFADAGERLSEVTRRYAEATDGAAALRAFVEDLYSISPVSSELGKLADERLDVSPALRQIVEDVRATLVRLLALAQEQGSVRRDVDLDDLELLLSGLKAVVVATAEVAPGLWRRHLALLLDALRPSVGPGLPAPDVDPELRRRLGRAAQNR
jgi:AcrR family transcriptional regulator